MTGARRSLCSALECEGTMTETAFSSLLLNRNDGLYPGIGSQINCSGNKTKVRTEPEQGRLQERPGDLTAAVPTIAGSHQAL